MKLYIVATPIGNLEDITLRALKVLKEVDFILCEDTRHSLHLLNHYQINKPLISYHQHSRLNKVNQIINLLKQGKNLALISDAGTPGISDPGNELIRLVLKEIPEVEIMPVPGVSVVSTLCSVAGFNTNRFLFLGFLPIKKQRQKFLKEIVDSSYPVVFYESPYRILKTLSELDQLDKEGALEIVVGKELTKMFEKIYRGKISEVIAAIKKDGTRGEYSVIVSRPQNAEVDLTKK